MVNAAPLVLFLVVGVLGSSNVYRDVELSYEVNEDSMHWVTNPPFTRQVIEQEYKPQGFWLASFSFCSSEHLSTHVDAPSHFARGKWGVADIPLERLLEGQGVVVDIREKVKLNSTAEMTADDLMAWMDEHGPLPDGAVVFVLTGWGSRYGNWSAYYGLKDENNRNDTSNLVYPGINPSAAQLLAAYEETTGRRVFAVGIDTASLDFSKSTDFKTHVELFQKNIYGMENVANLEKLPAKGFEVLVLPMKITRGTGAPARVIARIPQSVSSAMACTRVSWHYLLLLSAMCVVLKLV